MHEAILAGSNGVLDTCIRGGNPFHNVLSRAGSAAFSHIQEADVFLKGNNQRLPVNDTDKTFFVFPSYRRKRQSFSLSDHSKENLIREPHTTNKEVLFSLSKKAATKFLDEFQQTQGPNRLLKPVLKWITIEKNVVSRANSYEKNTQGKSQALVFGTIGALSENVVSGFGIGVSLGGASLITADSMGFGIPLAAVFLVEGTRLSSDIGKWSGDVMQNSCDVAFQKVSEFFYNEWQSARKSQETSAVPKGVTIYERCKNK